MTSSYRAMRRQFEAAGRGTATTAGCTARCMMPRMSTRRLIRLRVRHTLVLLSVPLALASALTSPVDVAAQQPTLRIFRVRETVGIRRTEYPVSVSVQVPKGALTDVSHARVMHNSAEVPVQFTARAPWDDGSVQTLDIDFNTSLEPEEDRRYELQFGPSVTAAAKPARGLTLDEQPTAVVVGNLTFSKSGSPLLASASYRGEAIGTGQNGLTLTDGNGRRHDLSKAQGANLEVVKGGPLLVVLRYTATIAIDETSSIPVELLMEMPNSKTWLKTTATVTDRTRKLKDIALERPYAWAGFPVLWDFGTESGTYGVFRAATDSITLTQAVGVGGPSGWKIESGPLNQRRAIEVSGGSRARATNGWGHIQDAASAVAFGFARFGRDAGSYTIGLSAGGQATYRFVPATPATQQQIGALRTLRGYASGHRCGDESDRHAHAAVGHRRALGTAVRLRGYDNPVRSCRPPGRPMAPTRGWTRFFVACSNA